ncbi:MAG: hypothetical protein IPP08_02525 [Chlorobiota bacterium]|nr:MAG: hypothetical protein IPP08_02525 [Chlorobiota bacterium]
MLLLSLIVSVKFFIKIEQPYKWIGILILQGVISELIAHIVPYIFIYFNMERTNSIVYHISTPIEFIIYAIIFSNFFNSKSWDKILFIMVILLLLTEVVNTIYIQPLNVSNTNIFILESLFLVFLSLVHFLKIRENTSYSNIFKEGVFWFNSAVLFYYSINILIWGFHSIKVYQLKNPPLIIYDILYIISGLLYLTYGVSIFLNSISNRNKLELS